MTKVPSTGGLHNEHSFLTILAARRSKIKIKVPADSVSGSWILSLFSHVVGGVCGRGGVVGGGWNSLGPF